MAIAFLAERQADGKQCDWHQRQVDDRRQARCHMLNTPENEPVSRRVDQDRNERHAPNAAGQTVPDAAPPGDRKQDDAGGQEA